METYQWGVWGALQLLPYFSPHFSSTLTSFSFTYLTTLPFSIQSHIIAFTDLQDYSRIYNLTFVHSRLPLDVSATAKGR